MKYWAGVLLPPISAWLLLSCAAVDPLTLPNSSLSSQAGPRNHSISIVSNGWHTSIVIERSSVRAMQLVPEADDFPQAAFLEFGWGDRAYYPAEDKSVGLALTAILAPTPAIMHVNGLSQSSGSHYAESEVMSLKLTEGELWRLIKAISLHFKRNDEKRAVPVSRGLYPDSHFYEAHGSFHAFNTCNTWTARMLQSAGFEISPKGINTAAGLMKRLRAFRKREVSSD